ncbi:enoyl-CoA hydratase [Oleiphilus sp. HI0068]|uniref:crotonase/enoyl-CoA hydratase family protein n=3 Tax=Oleiphilus TaxID=141450 RepID=UPI0007C2562A|nr:MULTISPECIES: crotonase/enoyl-CoA hydratase family protein [unclassified Oleiphilus]KZY77114.1 enoyl-CoA hydratase [Oleiphilus sp. HI0069]KZY77124.1 enoyl-CoA hydratase [Oleiphilus sp. HI0068]KZY85833.1 enoyl-CoA hydratase [Oleiphilus sp. HI0072]KZY29545.1 enoyl-CoA hydratase [Oleiphilus sp. HI0043]KZY58841.1 enoyl-CoA hydratase [Oleiphilus sp. HI0061]
MSYIEVDVRGSILLIKVNRAEKYNALTVEMYHDIARAYYQLEHDNNLCVAVFYAEGEHFSAGLELTDWLEPLKSGGLPPLPERTIDPFALSGPSLSKPVIMAVQGYSYTWVVEMMLNTDIRVASENARFAQLEVQRGLFACGGATIRLQNEMGWANAQRYLLTGDEWSAADAYRMGMIQEICEPGKQLECALALAQKIAKAAPLAVRGSLTSSKLARQEGEASAIKQLFPSLKPVIESEDMNEGVQSFIERRDAVFVGR